MGLGRPTIQGAGLRAAAALARAPVSGGALRPMLARLLGVAALRKAHIPPQTQPFVPRPPSDGS